MVSGGNVQPALPATHRVPFCQEADRRRSSLVWMPGAPPGCDAAGPIARPCMAGSNSTMETLGGVPVNSITPNVGAPLFSVTWGSALLYTTS